MRTSPIEPTAQADGSNSVCEPTKAFAAPWIGICSKTKAEKQDPAPNPPSSAWFRLQSTVENENTRSANPPRARS